MLSMNTPVRWTFVRKIELLYERLNGLLMNIDLAEAETMLSSLGGGTERRVTDQY